MTDYCRITGHARNLPKPCYFPLLPPITPADARKLGRLTGKAPVVHTFSPIIAFGKPLRFDGVEGCKITKFEDCNYVYMVFEKMKDNEMTFYDLESTFNKIKGKRKRRVETDREFVYQVPNQKTSLVVSPEMEEAIRRGDVESVSMSKDSKYINIKVTHGRIVKIKCKPMSYVDVQERDNLYYGSGQSKEVLEEQQRILNERNKKKSNTMARKMRFEGLEQKAEEEYLRDTVKPPFKKPRVKFNAKQRAEKLARMEAMMREQAQNRAIVLPKLDTKKASDEQLQYERMFSDITTAQVTSINITIVASGFDWAEAEAAESAGFDWDSFPHEEWIDPLEVEENAVKIEEAVVREDITKLEIVAIVETITPSSAMSNDVTKAVVEMKEETILKKTENISETLKSMKDKELVPKFDDVCKIAANIDKAEIGYMVHREEGVTFVSKAEYTETGEKAVSGAIVEVNEEKKFVAGQLIKLADQESFIAGQTVETVEGKKFVPGQTIMNRQGEINFIPGECVKGLNEEINFVAGQIFHTPDGPKFVSGQVMDIGDGKKTFVAGQTVSTEEGPKFTPGEVATDVYGDEVFVPGLKMPTADGGKFVAGQTFQSEEGITFKPGQILDTVEGPTFVPGKTFVTPEGKKFIKGDFVNDDQGKLKFEHRPFEVEKISEWLVIPNRELQPIAFADRNVAGFIVTPTNTDGIQVGEKLHGDMVETHDTVQFYISGKLPKDLSPEAKIIPGQLIVNAEDKRFIPGKLMDTLEGEKFVPGQLVNTTHGEEFIPGQVVESSEGPKFVPGQLVMTSQGEKFVPGQVIVEDEGPKFVPGQIIQTKNGATFIPGQMMTTDEGQLFVPGQLVDTNDGPRFVPGQVVESQEGPKFIPGTIIETDEGLKYVPPDADEYDEDFEISFQGYEVSAEELKLLMVNPIDARPHSPIMNEECLIDSATLKKLAAESVVVHGVTPEPPAPEKKRKRKRTKVQIDMEEEKMEVEEPDDGTELLELLNKFIKATSCINQARKEKEMRKLSNILGDFEHETIPSVQVDAMLRILSLSETASNAFRAFFGEDEETINFIVENIDDTDTMTRNDEAKKALKTSIQGVITSKCDKEIEDIIHLLDINPDNLLTDQKIQVLLTEAVGIVCVTGNVEVAAMLEKFISEPSDPNTLRDNNDVVKVLRQLLVLHQIAERDPEVARILEALQNNPEGLKDRRRVRELLRNANMFLCKPDANSKKKFDIRHVASSKDIPKEIFEQIKEDKKEADKFIQNLPDELFAAIMGDKRCGEYLLGSLDSEKTGRAKSELDKFKKGMAIVVTKENMQAVIPKEYSRSVCYGIIPYILIDEEGFKFFERGLTGRKLAPARVIENTWYMPDSYYLKKPSYERTMLGEQYSMTMLGRRKASTTRELLYTSLLPSAGPTRLCYNNEVNGEVGGGELVPYRSHHASNIIWTDLDGAPLTVHRKSQHLGYDFGDLDLPHLNRRQSYVDYDDVDDQDMTPRRQRRSLTNNLEVGDYDLGSFIYRRPSKEEREEYGEHYRATMPFQPVIVEEETDTPPVSALCRSDTVANLLTKYANFSTKREFGYKAPDSAWSRHIGKTRDFLSTLPDFEEEPLQQGSNNDMALVPAAKSQTPTRYDGDVSSARIASPKERSRSHTPLGISSPRENSVFQRESMDDGFRERSRGRESSFLAREDSSIRTRRYEGSLSSRDLLGRDSVYSSLEEPSIPPSRKRFSNIYEEDDEALPTSPKPREEKEPEPFASDVPDYLMQLPEMMGPRARPGGALERYRQRKAKEAQGIFEHPDYSKYYAGEENDLPPAPQKTTQPQQTERKPERKDSQDDVQNHKSESQYTDGISVRKTRESSSKVSEDSQHRGQQDTYNHAPHCPHSRKSRDPYSPPPTDRRQRSSQDPYQRSISDPYGRPAPNYGDIGMEDPYGRMPPDPYGRRYQDPYSKPMQDPYGGRYMYDPYGSRPMQEPYGRPPLGPYRSQGVEEDFDSRPSRGRQVRRGLQAEESSEAQYGREYSAGRQPYGRNTEEYGNGYSAGHSSSSSMHGTRGHGGDLSNGTDVFTDRKNRIVGQIMPFIDEDDRSGRSLTPREEERRAVGKLAQKYLRPRAVRDQYLDDE
ncbi:uncharacterized protein [Macrobrachium rosenbergii]|uniref:uncharacterized protein n=1 Tax=Macrobrachium rosenbergii TaxID=79674 RepID=UPI0034D525FF